MSEAGEDIVDGTDDVVDDVEDSTEAALREIRETVQGLRVDVDALLDKNDNPTVSTDAELGEDNPPAPAPSPAAPSKPDPYMTERAPIRRHGLFRRLTGG